jgi:hypothetical protein
MKCAVKLKQSVERKKIDLMSKCRLWRLKEIDMQKRFCDIVHNSALERSKNKDVECTWKGLKVCLMEVSGM